MSCFHGTVTRQFLIPICLEGDTYQVLGDIEMPNNGAHDLALSRDGKQLWVTNLANGRVSVIDTESRQMIASIFTGTRAHVVALTNGHL